MNTSILRQVTVGILVGLHRTGNVLFQFREESHFDLMANVQQLMGDVIQCFFVFLHSPDFVAVIVLATFDERLFESKEGSMWNDKGRGRRHRRTYRSMRKDYQAVEERVEHRGNVWVYRKRCKGYWPFDHVRNCTHHPLEQKQSSEIRKRTGSDQCYRELLNESSAYLSESYSCSGAGRRRWQQHARPELS